MHVCMNVITKTSINFFCKDKLACSRHGVEHLNTKEELLDIIIEM